MRRRKTLLIAVANANDDVNDHICIKMVTVKPGLWFSMRLSVLEHLLCRAEPLGQVAGDISWGVGTPEESRQSSVSRGAVGIFSPLAAVARPGSVETSAQRKSPSVPPAAVLSLAGGVGFCHAGSSPHLPPAKSRSERQRFPSTQTFTCS